MSMGTLGLNELAMKPGRRVSRARLAPVL